MNRNEFDLSIVVGTLVGIIAWVIGYVGTYVVVAPDVRESPLHRVIEALDGEPATYEMVGWVFYNAHFVPTVFRDVPIIGSHTTSYIGGQDGFTVLLYLLPIGLLVASGFVLAQYNGATDPTQGAMAGLLLVPAYLLLSIAGIFLFEVAVGEASIAPDLLEGIFIAGIVYPLLFGGSGGAIGGILGSRLNGSSTDRHANSKYS